MVENIEIEISKEIRMRGYSRKTKEVYVKYNLELIKYLSKKPDEIVQIDIKKYLDHLADDNYATSSTLNCAMNALRFYYGKYWVKTLCIL